ncbi:dipeptide ABC transporter ATP-binding protein [Pseudoruegeria sp. SHC-113]|uniref:dipeptide ABC transporter ATP-binding protein n=1 Tax=Pseudoruegeria sp. SHC-113 TaxID=2855439 RepID=UPI0021BB0104|nr:ABC transporter ATP-binding protein [Pseudoruegeria sp. SHC-113]MCT8160488.1 ABC transporter ATP-binding protein [Pseudoruegeria sp. SHC-113]
MTVTPEKPGAGATVLEVRGLSVDFPSRHGSVPAIQDVSFDLRLGQTTCFVGESGSGKSVTARAVMNIVEPAVIRAGAINLVDLEAGQKLELSGLDPDGVEIRAVRGARIAMIFQEPMSSLSPVHTIGEQIIEAILLHQDVDAAQAREIAIDALRAVQITDPELAVDKYPFEYSGGMRQRAMIAMALGCEPDILIADEPTTALDVTTQAEILKLLHSLQESRQMAMMFITHDMGVVAEIADQVVVMLHGQVVETGDVDSIFHAPQHAYTRKLLNAALGLNHADARPEQQGGQDALIQTRDLSLTFASGRRSKGGGIKALDEVSIDLHRGEILGIVGESGSGKTTLARVLMGRFQPQSGSATYQTRDGRTVDLTKSASFNDRTVYREMRMIFQDPYSSLNPRMTIEQIIGEPLLVNGIAKGEALRKRVGDLLERVGLPTSIMERYPHAFSGGQRQRIGIARAIALEPQIIIADEATSALDGSIRAQILDLLLDLRDELGLSILFIAHDIGVVRYFCDRVAVMHKGRVVETGTALQICDAPQEPYTQRLISAVPVPDPRKRRLIAAGGAA